MSDAAFLDEVEKAIVLYEKAIGHAASRTRNMIAEHGEIEALSRLMVSPDLQQGFKVLRDREQLDKTFEAVVVRFQDLFGRDAIEAANGDWRTRLIFFSGLGAGAERKQSWLSVSTSRRPSSAT